MIENCLAKEEIFEEVKFKLRQDGGGSRHVKSIGEERIIRGEGMACFPTRGRAWFAIGLKRRPPLEHVNEAESEMR